MTRFTKQPKTTTDLIAHLKGCGLAIRNDSSTRGFIESVGYYRVSGYVLLFEEQGSVATYPDGSTYIARSHKITPAKSVSFREVKELYAFDEELREITMSAISRFEVAIRAAICDIMAVKTSNSHWYEDTSNYDTQFTTLTNGKSGYKSLIGKIKQETKRNNIFCNHYTSKYTQPKLPPIWMVAEQMSMGTWAIIYPELSDNRSKKDISKRFHMSVPQMKAAILALSHLRNLCAHHARLVGANYAHIPMNDPQNRFPTTLRNSTYAYMLATLWHILKVVQPRSSVVEDLVKLCKKYPNIDVEIYLGLPRNWNSDLFWK